MRDNNKNKLEHLGVRSWSFYIAGEAMTTTGASQQEATRICHLLTALQHQFSFALKWIAQLFYETIIITHQQARWVWWVSMHNSWPFKETKLWWSFDMFTDTLGNDDGLIIKTLAANIESRNCSIACLALLIPCFRWLKKKWV